MKILTSPFDGELVSEDIISVDVEVSSNEMKTVELNYNPEGDFKEQLNFWI